MHIIQSPTSRMSLMRVILWKGRTRNDLRFCFWHTGSLSSFLIVYRKSLFCCLEKGRDVTECVWWEVAVVLWYRVQIRGLQQLVDEGLLVHHVSHIWHIEPVKLQAVPEHDVSDLRHQHALPQSNFQIHKKPRRDRTPAQSKDKLNQFKTNLKKREVLYVALSLFTGCHHVTNVGKQNVMLHSRQRLLQWLRRIEMINCNSEAPSVRRFRADQLKHRLQRKKKKN